MEEESDVWQPPKGQKVKPIAPGLAIVGHLTCPKCKTGGSGHFRAQRASG